MTTETPEGGTGERLPFAVCAPGMRAITALALILKGERVSEVRESRVLEGTGKAYLVTPPEFPASYTPVFTVPELPVSQVLRDRALAMTMIPPSYPLVLGSVI